MQRKFIIFLSAAILLSTSSFVLAQDSHDHEHMMDEKEMAAETMETTEEESELIYVNNKLCPVSGEEVGQMGEIIQQEYKGKVYNFCCKMCLTDFNKDPEKYVKIVEERMAQQEAEGEMHEDGEHMHESGHE